MVIICQLGLNYDRDDKSTLKYLQMGKISRYPSQEEEQGSGKDAWSWLPRLHSGPRISHKYVILWGPEYSEIDFPSLIEMMPLMVLVCKCTSQHVILSLPSKHLDTFLYRT